MSTVRVYLKIMNKAEKVVPRKRHPLITDLSSISNYLKTRTINPLFCISHSNFQV